MSKEYAESMRVVVPWPSREITGSVKAIVYELDDAGNQTGETVLVTNEQYRRLMLGRVATGEAKA